MTAKKNDPVVGVAAGIGGASVAIVAIFAIFAGEQLAITPWIIGALAVMGIGMSYFASKNSNSE